MVSKIRIRAEREHKGWLIRMWLGWTEVAYVVLGIRGLKAEIEFPSDWHERRMGWVRISFGLLTVAVAFPWKWTVPDEGQCSGPRYGFAFFSDLLWIYYGKDNGTRNAPRITVHMPWGWTHRKHEILTEPETHPYTYTLRSGEVQQRTATIKTEARLWTRYWFPWKRESRYIDIEFNDEVGERSGSWKGGCIGCSYDLLPGEAPVAALRRMELQRKF